MGMFSLLFDGNYATVSIFSLGVKRNTCGSGSRLTLLIFSADPIIFSTRLTVRPYYLKVVAGCSCSVPKWRLLYVSAVTLILLNQIA
jgi:hypothetical protein